METLFYCRRSFHREEDIPWYPWYPLIPRCVHYNSQFVSSHRCCTRTASAALPQEIVLPPLLSSPSQNLLQCLLSNCKISPQPTVQCVESKPLSGSSATPSVPWRLFTLGETRRQLRQEQERHKPSFSQGSNFVVDRQYSSIAGSSPGLAANILLSPQILNLSRLELLQWQTGEQQMMCNYEFMLVKNH